MRCALDLLKAWGTGHPGGIGTIHAGTALRALRRLEQLIQEVVVTMPRALIAETINVIAVLAGRGAECRPSELACVTGLAPSGGYSLSAIGDKVMSAQSSLGRGIISATAFATCYLSSVPVWAAGSNMPWEQPLNQILQSVEGPVAKIIAVIIIIVTGLSLAFGDTSGGFRRLIQIVFGLSIAFAASSFFLSFFSFGGGVAS